MMHNLSCYKCGGKGHTRRYCPSASGDDRVCYTCQGTGHMARECTKKTNDCLRRGGRYDRRTCYKCREEGHLAKHCPFKEAWDFGFGYRDFSPEESSTHDIPALVSSDDESEIASDDESENVKNLSQEVLSGMNITKCDEIQVDVTGSKPPNPISSFETSGLNNNLLKNVAHSNYIKPTPVQQYVIPIIMTKRDLMACAQTGSGKTAAFLLPMLNEMIQNPDLPKNADNVCPGGPWAVIVAPTTESVIKIRKEVGMFVLDSDMKIDDVHCETESGFYASVSIILNNGCHLLVATPDRLLDFLEDQVSLSLLRYLVLDDVDLLLKMDLAPAIRRIMEQPSMPEKGVRQTLMFCTTFSEKIKKMADEFLYDYLSLTMGAAIAKESEELKTLKDDILCAYKNQKFIDANLRTAEKIFPVHRFILSARSSVFSTMFEAAFEEGKTGVVEIPDVDADTMGRMLQFIYTDIMEDMGWEEASNLFSAADKYDIRPLKKNCASIMESKLSVSNVFEILLLTELHQDESNLRKAVQDFILAHDKEILGSEEWITLEESYPQVTAKVLRQVYLQKLTNTI